MGDAAQLLRKDNWWSSKIPPVLALAYLEIAVQDIPPARAFGGLAALLFSAVCLAAYGHVLNDMCDIEADRRAGKPNRVAALPVWQRTGLVAVLALLGLVPWLLVPPVPRAWAFLTLIYTLPVLYAVPPVRLKERGVWGVLGDASIAHGVPALFTLAFFEGLSRVPSPWSAAFMTAAASWAFAVGARGIVLHQIWDRENDLRSGLTTLVTEIGAQRSRRLILAVVFPAEMLALAGMGVVLAATAPLLLAVLVGCVILEVVEAELWKRFDPAPSVPGLHIPPHDLYQIWMPLVAASFLSTRHSAFLVLVVVQAVLFSAQIKDRPILAIGGGALRRAYYRARRVRRSLSRTSA